MDKGPPFPQKEEIRAKFVLQIKPSTVFLQIVKWLGLSLL